MTVWFRIVPPLLCVNVAMVYTLVGTSLYTRVLRSIEAMKTRAIVQDVLKILTCLSWLVLGFVLPLSFLGYIMNSLFPYSFNAHRWLKTVMLINWLGPTILYGIFVSLARRR